MKTNVPVSSTATGSSGQSADTQRRINAGWLRLWRTAYPEIPPPTEMRRDDCGVRDGKGGESKVQSLKSKVRHPKRSARAAEAGYLSRFLCVGFALALAVTGCAGPRPLKGGKAVTTRKATGAIEQTLVQGENPSQATKQDQETVKVRTYTVPAGSRMEQSFNAECGVRSAEGRKAEAVSASPQRSTINSQPINLQPSTLNSQPSTALHPERPNARGRA